MRAAECRRPESSPRCCSSRARAGGPGSRHLEPPLSPPFLSRSPSPPEMAEPRPGSHPPQVPSTGRLPGRVERSHRRSGRRSPGGAQTTIVGAAILRLSRFPAQNSRRSQNGRDTPRNGGTPYARASSSNSPGLLGVRAVRLVRCRTSPSSPPLLLRLCLPPWEPPS